MNQLDIAAQRMRAQHLLEPVDDPIQIVRELGCVQSQDYAGAKWALGMRCQNVTDQDINQLYNDGKILRTHVLRPTWHFVLPEDIRWMLSLTAPRVQAFSKYYYKKQELDDIKFKKANKLLVKSLQGGNHLTRKELAEIFRQNDIDVSDLRMGFYMGYAELEGIICSGAMKGKQHTYALISERAPQAKDLPRDKALAELTKRFFTYHGPATIQDFGWWSSLTMAEIKQGLDMVKLSSFEFDKKTYYYAQKSLAKIPSPIVHLLPNYDEYFIAYKDRSAFMKTKLGETPSGNVDWFMHPVSLDGQMVGGWKRIQKAKQLTVRLEMFNELNTSQTKALQKAAKKLETFLQIPVVIE